MNDKLRVVINILVLLCLHENKKLTSAQISEKIKIDPTRIRRLLGLIKNAGYVKTKEGIDGGYTLSIEPNEITLNDLYTVLSSEQLQNSKSPMHDKGHFINEIDMQLEYIFLVSESQLKQQLEKITLGSMLQKNSFLETCQNQ
ncbi:Rrf2 family transcriptional regulator [Paenibacillus sinopodophylli]|uniref:Rrf2 family transcriptional regulator n=1 Tax=Paenibacillus sinopodophylli TaxID=1837342 RepID=UPI001486BA9A|nr:Rrf2 family transcriptional regulator [Paenibacillus sinopodophylli]